MHATRRLILLAGASALAACATAPRQVAVAPLPEEAPAVVAAPAEPAPVSTLVEQVAIPHQGFRFANGLTVLVHEDHKAPVVAVASGTMSARRTSPRARPASPICSSI